MRKKEEVITVDRALGYGPWGIGGGKRSESRRRKYADKGYRCK